MAASFLRSSPSRSNLDRRSAIWSARSARSWSWLRTRSRKVASSSCKSLSSLEFDDCAGVALSCICELRNACAMGGKTLWSSDGSMRQAPDSSFDADIFPDFIALVMVAIFLPTAFAASPAVYCMAYCVSLHPCFAQVLRLSASLVYVLRLPCCRKIRLHTGERWL